MQKSAILAVILALCLPSSPAPAKTLPGPVAGAVLRVVDGDTVEARVSVWIGTEVTVLVRLDGIDAPELKGRCETERTRAKAAKDALAELLAAGHLTLTDIRADKYGGRVLARAFSADGTDIASWMLARDLARPYGGGKRGGWCGGA